MYIFTAEPPQSCRVSEKISDLKVCRSWRGLKQSRSAGCW